MEWSILQRAWLARMLTFMPHRNQSWRQAGEGDSLADQFVKFIKVVASSIKPPFFLALLMLIFEHWPSFLT